MERRMKSFETEHYIFSYLPGSAAERDIESIAEEQESCFEEIVSVLGVRPDFKIKYRFYNTPEQVGNYCGELCGDFEPCNGFAEEPDIICAVYTDKIQCVGAHEDAHIISYIVGTPDSVFIREGLAMYFDKKWWDRENAVWVRKFIEDGSYVSVESLFEDDSFYALPCTLTYPIAGSFTDFLIKELGVEKYLEFYRDNSISSPEKLKEALYTQSLDENFKSFILK